MSETGLASASAPMAYIAAGIAAGVTAYAALHLLGGRAREVSAAVWILAAVFALRYFPT